MKNTAPAIPIAVPPAIALTAMAAITIMYTTTGTTNSLWPDVEIDFTKRRAKKIVVGTTMTSPTTSRVDVAS